MAQSFLRRLRRGHPIVIVSGLPRSGTSMAMRMLEVGGLPVVTDGVREADPSNPGGYYELERVKELDKGGDSSWLRQARGKGVKIISLLLTYLPESYDYQVIFMRRDLDEILASQNKMLEARGEERGAEDARLKALYVEHLAQVERFLARRSCFSTLMLQYLGPRWQPGPGGRSHQYVPRRHARRDEDGRGCGPRLVPQSPGIVLRTAGPVGPPSSSFGRRPTGRIPAPSGAEADCRLGESAHWSAGR